MRPFVARELIYRPGQWLRREPVIRKMKELEVTQWYSGEELARFQEARLLDIVRKAISSVPYYAEVAARLGIQAKCIQSAGDLKRLPFLTKSTLKARTGDLLSKGYRGPISWKTTGGSTGQAVTVMKDRNATAYARAAMWRGYGWWGIRIGDRQGRFWGIPSTLYERLRYKMIDKLSNRIRLSSFNFSDEELYEYYLRLKRFHPDYLYGYASMIYHFAIFLKKNGLSLLVPKVVTTSEVLYPLQRRAIEEALHCSLINEYGCGELGPIGYECPSGSMHLMADNMYCEILKEDGTKAETGEIGQLIITELHNHAMPLVRYQIMDYVEVGDNNCKCGRGLLTIRRVIGRSYDYLLSSSGRRFHGEKVMYLLEQMQDLRMGVNQMQVIQIALNHLTIKLVTELEFNSRVIEHIRAYFREALGPNLNIDFQLVDRISREPSGKLRIVACEMKDC